LTHSEDKWDVAISFAGADRDVAREIVSKLYARGFSVYYDESTRALTVGQDLFTHLRNVYRRQARCCIAIISRHYLERGWTKYELGAALERLLEEEGYLLPLRLDDTEIPSLPEGIGYVTLADMDALVEAVATRVGMAISEGVQGESPARRREPSTAAESILLSAEQKPLATFVRTDFHDVVEIRDADLIEQCRIESTSSDPWIRWRLSRALTNHIGWEPNISVGPAHTCWRVGETVYLSTLPGVLTVPQKTVELRLAGSSGFLVAGWGSEDAGWATFGYEEFHSALDGLMADRTGCDLLRESALLVLKKRDVRFGFPVTPGSDPEEMCGWQQEKPVMAPYDWDRNPRIVGPGIGNWVEAHHMKSGAVVLVFVFRGTWSNAALYALRDTLGLLIPGRTHYRMMQPGSMRVVVLLGRTQPEQRMVENRDELDSVVNVVYLAIARACAAHDDVPVPSPDSGLAVRPPDWKGAGGLSEVVQKLQDKEHPPLSDSWDIYDGDEWLKPRHSLVLGGNLMPIFDFHRCSTPAGVRAMIAELEGALAG
jgi:TIR domain